MSGIKMAIWLLGCSLACAEGYGLRNGGQWIVECNHYEAYQLYLKGSLFICGDNECLDAGYDECDGVLDCNNYEDEDEQSCQDEWEALCEEAYSEEDLKPFSVAECDNGMCITECDVCDGEYIDCSDGSDETDCGENQPDPERCGSYDKKRKRSIRSSP
ncbi:uncharacterized protein [Apostichopus japonicus]